MSAEKFSCLLSKYLSNRLNCEEKREFFGLVETGEFDYLIGADFDNNFYADAGICNNENPAEEDFAVQQRENNNGKLVFNEKN